MNRQKGGAGIIALVALALIALVGMACFSSYRSAYDYGNSMENQLKAKQTDNKNIYAQGVQKVLEIVQVNDMYRDDLTKVVTAAIEGRYGEGGSKATFQFLQEHNPTLDPGLYVKVQQVIESFRSNFENGQRGLIDIRRQYETKLGSFWGGMWLKWAGYPKVTLSDFDIVSTAKADQVFKDKKEDGPLQLRPAK